jgi:SAM-dependent methyltransferase
MNSRMPNKEIAADRDLDSLYASLRGRYGEHNSRANGYLYDGYFRAEQRMLFSLLNANARVLVDVACGSGLMMQPLIAQREQLVCVDFNADACRAAKTNGLTVVRGDAFRLPLADAVIDEIVTCQFFNQQTPEAVQQFIAESARVLRGGGRLIMVWRNGSAWIHRFALACFKWIDRVRGLPSFPYENHSLESVRLYAEAAGLTVDRQAVSFPPARWCSDEVGSRRAKWIGASNICVLSKPG